MYPAEELIRLEAYKASLVRSIARRRGDLCASAETIAGPFAFVEHAWHFCRKVLQAPPREALSFYWEAAKLFVPEAFLAGPGEAARSLFNALSSRISGLF